jgi:hypothetical protein
LHARRGPGNALTKSGYISVSGGPIRFDERNQATPELDVAVIKEGRA